MKNELFQALLFAGFGFSLWFLLRKEKKSNTTNNNTNSSRNSDMDNVYLDIENLPRGYRNNNPLNIRYSKYNDWEGQILPNTDGTFAQFQTMAWGYRAALVLLRIYINTYGADTVEKIITRWAPASDGNNTPGYINNICKITGFSPATIISPQNKNQMTSLLYAMSICENGRLPLPDESAIEQGWVLYNS